MKTHASEKIKTKPELLAPAGRMETFFAAIEAGADAVYVGTRDFNARLRAPNFTLDELARMIAQTHARGRRLYVTVNTLVRQDELPELVRTLDALRRIGPDALIVQDFGVYRLARRLCPEIPLHASTQMTIHNLDGALQMQKLGFRRVILARELSLDEIRAIRASCTIELETFIHGALCYSISGQCLFSSYVHGKSANRGRCSQPCRRLFMHAGLPEGVEASLFSTCDLEAAPILSQLISAGIRGFKIEGRLKPAETISRIVEAYRMLIDAYPAIDRETITRARRCLDLAVGRKPSTGYYLAQGAGDVLGGDAGSHSGRGLGKAVPAQGGRFGLTTHAPIKTGDRIRVQVCATEPPKGFVVRAMFANGHPAQRVRAGQRVEIEAPFPVPAGAFVFKAADTDAVVRGTARQYERLRAESVEPAKAAFAATLSCDADGDPRLTIELCGDTETRTMTPAHRGALPSREVLRMLGEASPAFDVRLNVRGEGLDAELPVTPEEVRAFRETALHRVARRLARQRDKVPDTTPARTAPVHIIRVASLAMLDDFLVCPIENREHWMYALPLGEVDDAAFAAISKRDELSGKLWISLPTFIFEPAPRAQTTARIQRALQLGLRRFEVSNPGHFNLLHATGRRGLAVLATSAIGCMNKASFEQLAEMGADIVTYAWEGDAANLERLCRVVPAERLAIQVFGYVPLFQSRAAGPNVPDGVVRLHDPAMRLHIEHRDGLTIVLPPRPFSIRDRTGDLMAHGHRYFIHDFTFSNNLARDAQALLASADAVAERSRHSFNFDSGLE
ncbi:MAG: U32 family peptidase [Candidatus Hydrogenedentes bacterium]|nr:U32 family peptidase [Candidatus Hydrogenedentota bacterium]